MVDAVVLVSGSDGFEGGLEADEGLDSGRLRGFVKEAMRSRTAAAAARPAMHFAGSCRTSRPSQGDIAQSRAAVRRVRQRCGAV